MIVRHIQIYDNFIPSIFNSASRCLGHLNYQMIEFTCIPSISAWMEWNGLSVTAGLSQVLNDVKVMQQLRDDIGGKCAIGGVASRSQPSLLRKVCFKKIFTKFS